ncbi:hypothetical protein Agabi119p4_3934 [Agaricus bisporus var. burnettii]|uniref:Secreted protein n=1 Tax=Agaricus bisporus var. burnettii TaxID=192524 RepID=A0A8H7KIK6_AGABI|nr:hypothetical protein Agabi119p4_3934 [Agaricus bisporus var. burnettii]
MSIILSLVLICNLNSLTCKHCTTTTSNCEIRDTTGQYFRRTIPHRNAQCTRWFGDTQLYSPNDQKDIKREEIRNGGHRSGSQVF